MSDLDKRIEFAERLRKLSLHMYDAMSQGHDHRIGVTPEMAEDILAASEVIRRFNPSQTSASASPPPSSDDQPST